MAEWIREKCANRVEFCMLLDFFKIIIEDVFGITKITTG